MAAALLHCRTASDPSSNHD